MTEIGLGTSISPAELYRSYTTLGSFITAVLSLEYASGSSWPRGMRPLWQIGLVAVFVFVPMPVTRHLKDTCRSDAQTCLSVVPLGNALGA